jgi:hypothetical protein
VGVRNAEEAADAFEVFAALSNEALSSIAERTRSFASARFRTPDLIRSMIKEALE